MKSPGFGVVTVLVLFSLLSVPSRAADLNQKLKSIVVSIDFNHATIGQATAALASMSKQLDPEHTGIQFVVTPAASASSRPITLRLDNVPLSEAIRYACLLAGVHYSVDNLAVSINPMSRGPELVQRTFYVDPSFVEAATKSGILPSVQVQ